MKFNIEKFYEKLMLAVWLCLGTIVIFEQDRIFDRIVGILAIIMGISIMVITSFDDETKSKFKSKLEKAERKAIKYKEKLERKELKKCKKEYKSLKKEIFKCIAKGESKISYSFLWIQPIPTLVNKLNCDKDFKGLYFTSYSATILWERDKDNNE